MKAPFVPYTVSSIELTEPLRPLPMHGRRDALVLVRWKNRPIGWASLIVDTPAADVATLDHELTRQLEWPLIRATLADSAPPAASTPPPISVVICTRNRPALLERCLASCALLRYPTFEVIVVDNAPENDATRAIARQFQVRYVTEERPGLDWARNRGIQAARHDIVAFTDDDTAVDAAWLTGIATAFENPAIMAVNGLVAPMEMETPAQVLFEQVYGGMGKGLVGRLFLREQMRPSQMIAIHSVGVGANMAFRRAAFDTVGLFDTALDVGTPAAGGGDLDMFHRVVAAGLPLWYEPRALVWHQHRRDISQLERQLYNDGRSFGVYLQKLWRTRTVPRRSLLRYATWQWGRWLAGRVVLGALGRHRMPLPLLWAGLRGALASPGAYRATCRSDRLLRDRYPPAVPEPGANAPAVSVIVPAFNAADTIRHCLDSVVNQTHARWEVIVVDDGSSDETLALARAFAECDPRIRVLTQPHQGVSAARNLGLGSAAFPWVLFLDADDWILPEHLERMTAALLADPSLGAVHCGWTIAGPGGEVIEEGSCPASGDLFHLLARHPAFILHSCVVGRDLVRTAGGFDPDYSRIQDWIMWQRVARTGCRFGRVTESLAGYRMRSGSLSSEPREVLEQALRAIALGHAPDPQVSTPAPEHAPGRPPAELPEAQLAFLGWPAGIMLARGEDARPLLNMLEPHPWPDLGAYLGEILHSAAPRALGRPRSAWSAIWPEIHKNVADFLNAIEKHAMAPGLARSVHYDLARRILADSIPGTPELMGLTHAVRLEVHHPIHDIYPPPAAERLWASVEIEGERIGILELPVCSGVVPALVIRDAIADRFGWVILGRYFLRTIYQEYDITEEAGTWTASLHGQRVAGGTDHQPGGPIVMLHDQIGWELLLRESWADEKEKVAQAPVEGGRILIEVSEPLPDLSNLSGDIVIEVQAGGAPIGLFTIGPEHRTHPQAVRDALTDALGYEFCRAVVREALIGFPSDDTGLRDRLRQRAELARKPSPSVGIPLTAEWRELERSIGSSTGMAILGRHSHLPVGGSGSRRAILPGGALDDLVRAGSLEGQLHFIPAGEAVAVAYVPEIMDRPIRPLAPAGDAGSALDGPRRFDRHHFESSFARGADPWSYSSDYERIKYEQSLEMIPEGSIGRALELGSAEGHFTERLAGRVGSLVAADIADLALERAAHRCRRYSNIEFRRLDLVADPLPGGNDLVVCSEVLYYAGSEEKLREVASRIAEAIQPGGYLVTAHANVVVDEPGRSGFAWDVPYGAATISRVFGGIPLIRLVRELRTPLYRIQLYQRIAKTGGKAAEPVIKEEKNRALPSPTIARWIQWSEGEGPRLPGRASRAVTDRLPILMYHQVTPESNPARARWQVTPSEFERHMRYLRDTGFYSVTLETWRGAMGRRQPLPGRAVLITFDDGYLDFATWAWPILRRHGFSAVIFLATGRVGGRNDWDPVGIGGDQLLDWDDLRRLRNEGVAFGSHSATHRRLTGLTPIDVVREAAGSKATIERELGQSVTAFAYPYGEHDAAVQHLVGACGYDQGFTCRPGLSRLGDTLLDQARIEVAGNEDLTTFIARLG